MPDFAKGCRTYSDFDLPFRLLPFREGHSGTYESEVVYAAHHQKGKAHCYHFHRGGGHQAGSPGIAYLLRGGRVWGLVGR
jgi:hypothetical protein